jgi:hypothetical protein
MSEWPTVTLDQVLSEVDRPVEVSTLNEVRWAGVRWYAEGVYPRPAESAAKVKTKTLNRLQAGDITYNRMWATKAAFGVVGADSDGCLVSGDFPIFVARDDALLPAYMRRVFATETFQADASLRAVGTTERRRLKERDFLAMQIALPSVHEQQRIVTVLSAVDAQVEALEVEVIAAGAVLQRVLSATMQDLPSTVAYGTLATTRSGPSWAAGDETKTPVDGSLQVVKITNTKADGTLDMTDETYVCGLPVSTPTLDAGSLIVVRTNGNRNRIGNVYRPTPVVHGCAVSAFQFISQAHDHAERDFLYWALREPSMQQRMSEAASGSTGLGNLAVKWLNAVEIPWSNDPNERATVVARLDSTRVTADALAAELATLRTLRSDLLSALLLGEITVDAAVDKFLKAA